MNSGECNIQGASDQFVNSYLASKIPSFVVAYMDVAVRRPDEGREQERKLWKPSQYSLLLAISASNLDILDRNLLRRELIRGSLVA